MNNEQQPQPFYCPKHTDTQLRLCFSSGAGWCSRCHFYVQGAGIEPPQLDEWVAASRVNWKKARQKLYRQRAKARKLANEKITEAIKSTATTGQNPTARPRTRRTRATAEER